MNYAVLTPAGALHRVILGATVPEGFTPESLGVLPVQTTIPDGHRQDFTQGPATARGWQLVDGAAVPITVPVPAPEAPTVPEAVTPRQIRRALNAAGLRSAVEAAVAQASQDVRDDWEFALEVRRDHPELNAMATALGLTSEQLDALFIAAAAIE
jgi:hypothetical protein